ncbi:DUF998 domain-containing protein [Diaminobutyricibacter sp. McL0618]|uniref:DUF998 domain-containing protein n=1 Tax=Leifsonia sp. McL0618 TaxID=3415677 RepID=UPI003CFA9B40
MSREHHPGVRLSAIHIESRSVQLAAAASGIGAVAGAIAFWQGSVPLFGPWSIGTVAAITGSVLGAGGFVFAYLRALGPLPPRKQDRLALPRRVLDTTALTVNHVAIWLILSLGTFLLLDDAFRGLRVDTLTAAVLVAVATGISTYFMQASGNTINSLRISTLLSIFIASGVLASMITAPDPAWWKRNFSDLGTMAGFSGFAFNFTLIVTGGLILTLSDYVMVDVRKWARSRPDYNARKVSVIGWGLVGEGAFLAGVGIFPVNRFHAIHNTVAISLVVLFVAMVFALPNLLPGFPATFVTLGYAFLGAVVVVTLLYFPIGYYNLTALELVASAVILGWIIIFIRTAAALNPAETTSPASDAMVSNTA